MTLVDEVACRGFAVVRAPGFAERVVADPWGAVVELVGSAPRMVERQPIRAIMGGRSFASNSAATPLHTDSQAYRGLPPALQLMSCIRPAARGGETHLVDAWALLERLERDEPALFEALFTEVRRIPFVFGEVVGPTAALRMGHLVFTHAPVVPQRDAIARELERVLERAPRIVLRVVEGETLVVDNHRMLHGRAAFLEPGPGNEAEARAFERLLAWLPWPRAAPARFVAKATHAANATAKHAGGSSEWTSIAFGVESEGAAAGDSKASRRLGAVLAMLRGVPPGVLARRSGELESDLYRFRDAALLAAERALGEAALAADRDDLEAALARLRTARR